MCVAEPTREKIIELAHFWRSALTLPLFDGRVYVCVIVEKMLQLLCRCI